MKEGRWTVARPIDWSAMPLRVESLVRDQVDTLDEAARTVLEAAGMKGEEYCVETVAAALERPVWRVVEVLAAVLGRRRPSRSRVLDGRRLSLYRFRHAMVRRYVYGRLDDAERTLRHDRAAAAVRAVWGDAPEGEGLRAGHLASGTRPGLAGPPLLPDEERP